MLFSTIIAHIENGNPSIDKKMNLLLFLQAELTFYLLIPLHKTRNVFMFSPGNRGLGQKDLGFFSI